MKIKIFLLALAASINVSLVYSMDSKGSGADNPPAYSEFDLSPTLPLAEDQASSSSAPSIQPYYGRSNTSRSIPAAYVQPQDFSGYVSPASPDIFTQQPTLQIPALSFSTIAGTQYNNTTHSNIKHNQFQDVFFDPIRSENPSQYIQNLTTLARSRLNGLNKDPLLSLALLVTAVELQTSQPDYKKEIKDQPLALLNVIKLLRNSKPNFRQPNITDYVKLAVSSGIPLNILHEALPKKLDFLENPYIKDAQKNPKNNFFDKHTSSFIEAAYSHNEERMLHEGLVPDDNGNFSYIYPLRSFALAILAKEIFPTSAQALSNIGTFLSKYDLELYNNNQSMKAFTDKKQALAYLEEAHILDPKNPSFMFKIIFMQERASEALRTSREYYKYLPNDYKTKVQHLLKNKFELSGKSIADLDMNA